MNILVVPPNDLISNVIPNRLYHLARHWQEKHTIYLLRYPNYPTSTNIERPLRYELVTFDAKPASNPGFYYLKNARAIYEALKHVLKREYVDVIVHANVLPSLFAVRLARKYSVKTVFDYLDHYPDSASIYYKNLLAKKVVYTGVNLITSYNLRWSDRVVTVSYTLKQLIERYTTRPVEVIPNGVDTELFRPMPRDQARRQLSLEDRHPIVLYYGSITEWVDYGVLLEATAKLKERYPKMLLLLVGKIYKQSEELEIKQRIEELKIGENVAIIPPQPQERIPLYIAASNVIVAPHKPLLMNFGIPLKLLEPLACEKPVVTSIIPEFKIWLRDLLFYYESLEELVTIITYIVENPELILDQVKKARTYIVKNFDWKKLAVKYENLLKNVLGS